MTPDQRFALLSKSLSRTNITLNRAGLQLLPASIANFRHLKKLLLRDNFLSELPDEVGLLQSLELLHLGNNELHVLPSSLCKLINLQRLHLFNNNISRVPEELSQLNKLVVINLNHNKITELPDSIGNLKHLIELAATHNELQKLPSSIGECISLQELNLTANKIQILPDSLALLKKLETIVLVDNELQDVPSCLFHIKSLRELDISMNHIQAFTNDTLKWSRSLKAFHYEANTFMEVIPVDELPQYQETMVVPLLTELAARVVSERPPQPHGWPKQISENLKHLIYSAQNCVACNQRLVGRYLEVVKFIPMRQRVDDKVPLVVRMCSKSCLIAKRQSYFPTANTIRQMQHLEDEAFSFIRCDVAQSTDGESKDQSTDEGVDNLETVRAKTLLDAKSTMNQTAHWSKLG